MYLVSFDTNGGLFLNKNKKRILIDLLYTVILIGILLLAYIIKNSIARGILLFVFSVILGVNSGLKLKDKIGSKICVTVLYGFLLFFNIILAVSSLYVVITAFIEA